MERERDTSTPTPQPRTEPTGRPSPYVDGTRMHHTRETHAQAKEQALSLSSFGEMPTAQ